MTLPVDCNIEIACDFDSLALLSERLGTPSPNLNNSMIDVLPTPRPPIKTFNPSEKSKTMELKKPSSTLNLLIIKVSPLRKLSWQN